MAAIRRGTASPRRCAPCRPGRRRAVDHHRRGPRRFWTAPKRPSTQANSRCLPSRVSIPRMAGIKGPSAPRRLSAPSWGRQGHQAVAACGARAADARRRRADVLRERLIRDVDGCHRRAGADLQADVVFYYGSKEELFGARLNRGQLLIDAVRADLNFKANGTSSRARANCCGTPSIWCCTTSTPTVLDRALHPGHQFAGLRPHRPGRAAQDHHHLVAWLLEAGTRHPEPDTTST